ncbi:MAG: hypothetical protein AAF899_11270 [Pseudomonadota bacterium]
MIRGYVIEVERVLKGRMATLAPKKSRMKERHCAARQELKERQALRRAEETKERAGRFRKGALGLWDWVTGTTKQIRKDNECGAYEAVLRDDRARDAQISAKLEQRKYLKLRIMEMKRTQSAENSQLMDCPHRVVWLNCQRITGR